jgi:hypothetical protein
MLHIQLKADVANTAPYKPYLKRKVHLQVAGVIADRLQLNAQRRSVPPELLQAGLAAGRSAETRTAALDWPAANKVADAGLCSSRWGGLQARQQCTVAELVVNAGLYVCRCGDERTALGGKGRACAAQGSVLLQEGA